MEHEHTLRGRAAWGLPRMQTQACSCSLCSAVSSSEQISVDGRRELGTLDVQEEEGGGSKQALKGPSSSLKPYFTCIVAEVSEGFVEGHAVCIHVRVDTDAIRL